MHYTNLLACVILILLLSGCIFPDTTTRVYKQSEGLHTEVLSDKYFVRATNESDRVIERPRIKVRYYQPWIAGHTIGFVSDDVAKEKIIKKWYIFEKPLHPGEYFVVELGVCLGFYNCHYDRCWSQQEWLQELKAQKRESVQEYDVLKSYLPQD